MRWVVYLVGCADGTLYCGMTNHLKKRVRTHNDGKGAKYTRGRRPVHLLWSQPCASRIEAAILEHHIKKLSRTQKLRLIEDSKA